MPDDVAANGGPILDVTDHQLANLAEIIARFMIPQGRTVDRLVANDIAEAIGESLPLRYLGTRARWRRALRAAITGHEKGPIVARENALQVLISE